MAHNRMTWLDCLRLLAGLSMVVLHTTADPHGRPWVDYDQIDRVGPIILRTIAYMARTELFLLIACFLLVLSLKKRPRSYTQTISEQARRLLVPFLFWTIFYAFYNLIKAYHFGYLQAAIAEITTPSAWVGHLLLGDIKYHMHFLPTLFGLALFYPLFLVAYDQPIFGLAIFPLLLIKWQLEAQIWAVFWGHDVLPFIVRAVKLCTYVGYGMAAAALAALYKNASPNGLQRAILHIILFALLLMVFKGFSSYRTISEGHWQFDDVAAYWADFLMPIILFYICMSLSERNWPNALTKYGAFSFGIYLCHPIVVDVMEITLQDIAMAPILQVLTKLVAALAITPVLVLCLSKMRHLAWTVGLGPFPLNHNNQSIRT